jgi:hypothetical protein
MIDDGLQNGILGNLRPGPGLRASYRKRETFREVQSHAPSRGAAQLTYN